MKQNRGSRNRRRPGRVLLTERDEALLRALGRFRVARSSDLRRLLFGDRSPGRSAERLRQLFHAGYLDVRVGRLSEENHYSLGRAGRRWVESQVGPVGRMPAGGLAHHLAIVSAWTQLAAAVRQTEVVELRRFRPDWEIRESQGRFALPVVPDALVELHRGGEVLHWALEVDLATERHAVWRRKLEAYRRLRWRVREAWGWAELSVLVLVWAGGVRRVTSLRELVGQVQVTGFQIVERESWPAAALSLTPFTTPAYSKRGVDDVTTDAATAPPEEKAGPSPKRLAGSVGS